MRFTRNRGSKRLRARGRGGRFARSTLSNTFGLRAPVCAECRGFNTVEVGEPDPETCVQCGAPFRDLANVPTAKEG